MEPITIALIALAALVGGAGAGSAVTAHKKNKVISALQKRIHALQKKIRRYAEIIRKQNSMLRSMNAANAELELALSQSIEHREKLMAKVHTLNAAKAYLEGIVAILYFFFTLSPHLRSQKIEKAAAIQSKIQGKLKGLDIEISTIQNNRADVRSQIDELKSEIKIGKEKIWESRENVKQLRKANRQARA